MTYDDDIVSIINLLRMIYDGDIVTIITLLRMTYDADIVSIIMVTLSLLSLALLPFLSVIAIGPGSLLPRPAGVETTPAPPLLGGLKA
jgi:hypothetical protein